MITGCARLIDKFSGRTINSQEFLPYSTFVIVFVHQYLLHICEIEEGAYDKVQRMPLCNPSSMRYW